MGNFMPQPEAAPSAVSVVDRAVTGPARSLFEIEDFLAAMVESAEAVTPEQMKEYLSDLGEASDIAVQKRDRCAQAIFRYEEMIQIVEARRAHLQDRMDQMAILVQRVRDEQRKFEKYLISIVEQYGAAPKGAKNKRLEGRMFALALATSPDSVVVTEEKAVPKEFKKVAVKIALPVYERLVELGFTQGYTEKEMPQGIVEVVKAEVKKALDAGEDVPGADLKYGTTRLEVKARKL